MALEPIPRYLRKAYQDFSGGLNSFDSALLVKQNQFTELENAVVNDRGLIEKTKGYSIDGSPFPDDVDSFIRMVANYKRGTTVDKLMVAALDEGNSNATYKVDVKETSGDGTYSYVGYTTGTATFTNASATVTGSGTAWNTHLKAGDKIKPNATSTWYEIQSVGGATSITLTSTFSEATQTNAAYMARIILNADFIPRGITFNDNFVVTNGSDTPTTYNNTTVTLITDADCPKGKFIEAHKSRIFIASTSGEPSSVFWSAVNDETSWDATSVEEIFPKDGGQICAIKSFADSLVVFKDNGKIYQVVGSFDQDAAGSPDFIRKVDVPENIGNIAGYSAVVGNDNKLYFLAQTGIYSLDSRMGVVKVSWNIDNLVSNIILRSGSTKAKSYIYDSESEWDVGTHSGTIARSDGKLRPFYDSFSITDAKVARHLMAVAIDSSNNVHVAYVESGGYTIKYKMWLASDNSLDRDETVYTNASLIESVSISVASGGNVVVGFGSSAWYAIERSGSSWGSPVTISTSGNTAGVTTEAVISLGYEPTGTDIVGAINYTQTSSGPSFTTLISYIRRVSGTWSVISTSSAFTSGSVNNVIPVSFAKSGTTVGISGLVISGSGVRLAAFKSTSSGDSGTFSKIEDIAITPQSGLFSITTQLDGSGNVISSYVDSSGNLIKRNHSTATSTVVDSGSSNYFKGYVIYNGNDYYYRGNGTTIAEKYTYGSGGTNVTNSTTGNIVSTQGGDRALVNNGPVFASISFGSNSNEIIIRRITFEGTYTSDERSDSTLSAWGTYSVSGEVSSGNTIAHTIALASSSPPSSFNSITSGSVISTDASLVFVIFKVAFTLTTFATSEIDSVTLNYDGEGVGAAMPIGTVFNNEYYISYAESGDSANIGTVVLDSELAWRTILYPVTFMTRYKDNLYAGGATTGKIYKLVQNYRFNASSYTMTAVTKEDLLGSLELKKEIKTIYLLYEVKNSGTIDFSYRTDNFAASGGSSWTTTSIDQTTEGIAEIPYTGLPFRSIQFKIENDELDAQVGIIGFVIVYGLLGIR